ncbi:hypothetical protein [Williamsia muralis]|uniref:Uncharacterized protein n=1 Tax=Williamsia marianensis TaxID=85044 RepID=A0A2G3PRW9_WILMA|nr:hypothetical protein [Williamsia marianensis]PHV68473.1 hypothetical protein CSW57_04465 [Williamsia marianensis]
MNSTMTLSDLTALSGLEVFDYLDTEMSIPVVDGLQAQGDLLVTPADILPMVTPYSNAHPEQVSRAGIELLRSAAGGNPHSLVSEAGHCMWMGWVIDPRGLALGILDTQVVAYLIHPEHGATGIAPGRYVIGRQQEFDTTIRRTPPAWANDSYWGRGRLVAD